MSTQCLASSGSTAAQTSNLDVKRLTANYKPSIWSCDFLQSLQIDDRNHEEVYGDNRWKLMEEDLKNMIDAESLETTLELIDDIQQLDVFKFFMDCDGSFKDCLCKDVKGMLSLYEASFLGIEGETLLEKALAFTSMHLKNLSRLHVTQDKGVLEQVSHALEMPLHHRMQRLDARWYIEAYSKKAYASQVLLEFAKLDYNVVQQTYQRDFKDISRWWKDKGLAKKLSFSRDRLMEWFFWSVGIVSEPQFSDVRKGITKVGALITTIDDVYDVYGTLDELELFTSVVERWDVNAVEILSDYQLELCFLALYNTVNEMTYETLKEQGVNVLPYLTKAYTPTFDEYLANAWISVSGVVILVHTYFLLNQNISNEALKCLENHHDLLCWQSVIFRLLNDLATLKAELERGETATSISCIKRGGVVSDEESAHKYISNLIESSWKKMNKDGLIFGANSASSPFTKEFVAAATNLARIAQCIYQYGDGIGAPDKRVKNRILAVIVQPV
ncbi:putative lyase [Rosa chinensis]|uniref:Putative lyase n=1 Tax=Rosa chinensis TaxID=74649 RepID=A0A2P6S2J8_ROSCH|nr:putative lyase [Rosa chinensis]